MSPAFQQSRQYPWRIFLHIIFFSSVASTVSYNVVVQVLPSSLQQPDESIVYHGTEIFSRLEKSYYATYVSHFGNVTGPLEGIYRPLNLRSRKIDDAGAALQGTFPVATTAAPYELTFTRTGQQGVNFCKLWIDGADDRDRVSFFFKESLIYELSGTEVLREVANIPGFQNKLRPNVVVIVRFNDAQIGRVEFSQADGGFGEFCAYKHLFGFRSFASVPGQLPVSSSVDRQLQEEPAPVLTPEETREMIDLLADLNVGIGLAEASRLSLQQVLDSRIEAVKMQRLLVLLAKLDGPDSDSARALLRLETEIGAPKVPVLLELYLLLGRNEEKVKQVIVAGIEEDRSQEALLSLVGVQSDAEYSNTPPENVKLIDLAIESDYNSHGAQPKMFTLVFASAISAVVLITIAVTICVARRKQLAKPDTETAPYDAPIREASSIVYK